jgi:hypothetical protein
MLRTIVLQQTRDPCSAKKPKKQDQNGKQIHFLGLAYLVTKGQSLRILVWHLTEH